MYRNYSNNVILAAVIKFNCYEPNHCCDIDIGLSCELYQSVYYQEKFSTNFKKKLIRYRDDFDSIKSTKQESDTIITLYIGHFQS